jgi:pyruvate kinase
LENVDKLTKIIATIGPSSDSSEKIEELINLGVDIFRFNFKHSDPKWHKDRVERVKEISRKLNKNIATLIDLQGPEIRAYLASDTLELKKEDEILVSKTSDFRSKNSLYFRPLQVAGALEDGQRIVADDGHFVFTVVKKDDEVYLKSETEGILLNKKTINIRNLEMDFSVLTENDEIGIKLAKELDMDFVALSFVRSAGDIEQLRVKLKEINSSARIIAKIETFKAIKNIDEIIVASDAVMIARGDMGVELSLEEVPFFQKEIIKKCVKNGVPVVTATQMLETMTNSKMPTRAEVSDVSNAVFDFTDAVMLSGETAMGIHPEEVVKLMARVVKFSEENNKVHDIRDLIDYELNSISEMVCDSAFNLYKSLKYKERKIRGFIVFTHSGKTARILSRYRMHSPIFAFCPNDEVARSLSINYGVTSIIQEKIKTEDEVVKEEIQDAIRILKEKNICTAGDTFVVLHGDYWTSDQGTSTIRIITVS